MELLLIPLGGGAGGFTVTINFGEISTSYCHIDSNFLVSVNEKVSKGQVIAKVGPFNVYNVSNNPYKDKSGNPTNGATTRMSFASHRKEEWPGNRSAKFVLN